jgi:hypothetical protein
VPSSDAQAQRRLWRCRWVLRAHRLHRRETVTSQASRFPWNRGMRVCVHPKRLSRQKWLPQKSHLHQSAPACRPRDAGVTC